MFPDSDRTAKRVRFPTRFAIPLLSVLFFAAVVGAQDPNYTMSLSDAVALEGDTFNIVATLDIAASGLPVAGWVFGVCNDPVAATPIEVYLEDSATVLNGFPPQFAETATYPDGWTAAIIPCIHVCGLTLPPGTDGFAMASADYVAGDSGIYSVDFCDAFGNPPLEPRVVLMAALVVPIQVSGTLVVATSSPFIGGDCNGDSVVDLADHISLLSQLFNGAPASLCPIACDANGDGILDIADPVYIGNYLFLGGPEPAGPPTCDTVAGQTPEDCATATCLP